MYQRISLALLLILGLVSPSLQASHLSEGEIFYEWIGDEPNKGPYDYRVFVSQFRRNPSGTTWPSNLAACAFNGNSSISFTLNMLDPAQPLPKKYQKWWKDLGKYPSDTYGWNVDQKDCNTDNVPIFAYRYVGEVTLSGPSASWKFAFSAPCCRGLSDNLASSGNVYLEARLNNLLGPNSSPNFTSSPVPRFCVNKDPQTYLYWQQAAQEFDGDSLYIEFDPDGSLDGQCPNGNSPTSVAYDSGYSASRPLDVLGPIQINHQKGIFKMRPAKKGTYYLKVLVKEFRFDTISLSWLQIGTATREVRALVSDSCRPSLTQSPELCMVGFDPATQKIKVRLDSSALAENDSLFLLRGSRAIKLHRDSLGRGVYTDHSVPGMGLPVKYRLSALHACGYYTDTSTLHESMALSAQLNGSSAQLSWSPYRGKSIAYYKLYQTDSAFDNIKYVGQVPNNTFTYTVNSVLSSTNYFLVEAVLQDSSCLPALYLYDGPLAATQISQVGQPNWDIRQISPYPNPTDDRIAFHWPRQESRQFSIINLAGQTVHRGSVQKGHNQVNLSRLAAGTYLFRVSGINGAQRIVKQ